MSEIRVLVVDDHLMFAQAIQLLLERAEGISIVGIAASGSEALEFCAKEVPDVVLMDIDLPGMNGIETTERILQLSPDTRVVVVTAFQEGAVMSRAVQAGAVGFVPKTRASEDLVDVIRRAAAGEMVLPSGDLAEVLNKLQLATSAREDSSHLLQRLTGREHHILQMVADGKSTLQIARELYISAFTVQSHVKNILAKLGVHSKLEAVTFALRQGGVHVGAGTRERELAGSVGHLGSDRSRFTASSLIGSPHEVEPQL